MAVFADADRGGGVGRNNEAYCAGERRAADHASLIRPTAVIRLTRPLFSDPRFAGRMMDVKNFDGRFGDAVENAIRIRSERYHAYAGPSAGPLRAFGPVTDPGEGNSQPPIEVGLDLRVVNDEPIDDFVEIREGVFGEDDLHVLSLASTASTCSSVANRPSAAARRPRSMPASSSGVGS